MEPASITIFGVEPHPTTYALRTEKFTIGYRTEGFDVNIQPDALSDACCPEDYHIDIVEHADSGGHQLVWRYELREGEILSPQSITPIFINGYRNEIGPVIEVLLQDGDLVVCGCQSTRYRRRMKNGAGTCIFQYRAARPSTDHSVDQLSQLENMPLEMQLKIFSYLDPTHVAMSVAATSSKLCRVVKGEKVAFKKLPVSREVSPCTLRLWQPVTRGGLATSLKLVLDFKRVLKNQEQANLHLETVLDILGESKLTTIDLELRNVERTSPDVRMKIIRIIQDQQETLKSLCIHGDCSMKSMWQELPRLTNVTRLLFHPVASSVETVDEENKWLAETEVLAMLLEKLSDSLTTLSVHGGFMRGDLISEELLANLVHVRFGYSCRCSKASRPSDDDEGQSFSSLFWQLPRFLETLAVYIVTETDFDWLSIFLRRTQVKKLSLNILAGFHLGTDDTDTWISILSRIPSPTLEVLRFYTTAGKLMPSILLHMASDRQESWPLRICSIQANINASCYCSMPLAFLPLPFVAAYPFLEMLCVDVGCYGLLDNFIPETLKKTRTEEKQLIADHFVRPFLP